MIILVTGGARSGKSSFAERFCMKHSEKTFYIATSQALDDEMEERIARHRQEREETGYEWITLEEPLRLGEVIDQLQPANPQQCFSSEGRMLPPSPVVLIDCLSVWLSNVLLNIERQASLEATSMNADNGQTDDEPLTVVSGQVAALVEREIDRFIHTASAFKGTLVMVTNEVGSGVVPAYPLGRLYRDLAGRMNQRMAGLADQVFLVTAGIPIELKSREYKL